MNENFKKCEQVTTYILNNNKKKNIINVPEKKTWEDKEKYTNFPWS